MSLTAGTDAPVDVCIVVEGCYPFITGGVSSWLDWLIRTQPDLTFGIVAITADETTREVRFDMPPNVHFLQVLPLARKEVKPGPFEPDFSPSAMTDTLVSLLSAGDARAFESLVRFCDAPMRRKMLGFSRMGAPISRSELLNSFVSWQGFVTYYERVAPNASFIDFFWAWRNLLGGLFSVLTAPVPAARSFHAISTGYAGLYGARSVIVTGSPLVVTEHGIYTNERRIDLIMADWIPDLIERGYRGRDDRTDIRDFWIDTFGAFARITYASSRRITTLYGENQNFQREFGAADDKLKVIPNGIDLPKFAPIQRDPAHSRPTVALIGRVVPIKDIITFIIAADHVKRSIPDVEFLILGPFDEDQSYFEACKEKIEELGLQDTIRLTGKVNIIDYLPKIDVLVLTSISEAQPLVLLEAGAAGIPSVATDVGSCREIIEGAPGEHPNLGSGGRVVPPMNAAAVGAAISELLEDDALRHACGEVMKHRVRQYFSSDVSSASYLELYREVFAA